MSVDEEFEIALNHFFKREGFLGEYFRVEEDSFKCYIGYRFGEAIAYHFTGDLTYFVASKRYDSCDKDYRAKFLRAIGIDEDPRPYEMIQIISGRTLNLS